MKRISIITLCLIAAMCATTTHAQRTAEDFYKSSYDLLRNRDLDGALAALDKAIALNPDFALAYAQRSRLDLMKGALDSALTDVDKALLIDPEMKQAYAERARIRMMKNDMKGALSDLDNAVVRGYRSDEVYSSRANLRVMTRDFEGAISDFNTAISMNPSRIGNYLGRGAARSVGGDDDGALVDYTYVIDKFEQEERDRSAAGKGARRSAPFDMTSPVISGPESSTRQEKTSSTGKTVREVTKTEAVVTMRVNTGPGMTAEKMEYLPNVAGAYMNRGSIYSTRGDSDAAIADLTKSITIHPFFAAYFDRGKEFRKRGDLSGAIADFTKAIELRPQMANLYLERGVALLQIGKDDEAEKDFAQTLALDPRLKTTVETRRVDAKRQQEKKSP
jgi:tetratricopeptide (TPR) repeat protein